MRFHEGGSDGLYVSGHFAIVFQIVCLYIYFQYTGSLVEIIFHARQHGQTDEDDQSSHESAGIKPDSDGKTQAGGSSKPGCCGQPLDFMTSGH